MNITSKLTAYTVFVIAMVLSLLLMMNYFKFQNILSDVTTSRLAVINKNLEDSINNAVNLGLALEEIQVGQLINRAKKNDKEIESIDVFDANGMVIFSTTFTFKGIKTQVPPKILNKVVKIKEPNVSNDWSSNNNKYFVVGVTIYNSFDRAIGGIVLKYDKTQYKAEVASMLKELLISTGLTLFGAALIAFVGIRLGFRRLSRSYASMEKSIQNIKNKNTPTVKDGSPFDEKLQKITKNIDEAINLINQSQTVNSTKTK
tara:strand:+ start:287 stop:1063 length:777 start_codon:yes stop_codon:yes gene_type:complete